MLTDQQTEGVRQWYNFIAEGFQERYEGEEGEYLAGFEDIVYDSFVDCTDKEVLDLGTGGGRFALRISGIARQVFGIDISEEMIRIAQSRKSSHANVHFEVGDAEQLRFSDQQFDIVVSAGMFEYMQDMSSYFREVHRVLKPGGVFVFTCHRSTSKALWNRIHRKVTNMLWRWLWRVPQTEYVLKMDQRSRYYQKSYHRYDDVRKMLVHNGFANIGHRTSFSPTATLLFALGSRMKSRAIKRSAIRLNSFLSSFPMVRGRGPVMMVKAHKIQ